ncbi:MAG: O-methyltransferase [Mollicutes bacterium]|nr:O-methyltransferase [Mollicutes bacterium]
MVLRLIEDYAKKHKIPIMQKEGINFLVDYIKNNNIKTILEIGSAIGYSAINMALVHKDIKIITIERDKELYFKALQNIKDFGLEKQIEVINADALDVELEKKFDLIFIDAAKAQYINFFVKFKDNLSENGVIITDNINFHGLVENIDNITSKRLKSLVKKIKKYIDFLKENEEFTTEFVDVGDGISISKRNR